jgi:phosphoesterase family protein
MSNVKLLLSRRGEFKSLFRCLPDPAMWRWYSSDPGILRAIDGRYELDFEQTELNGRKVDHFAYFDEATERQPRTFLRDVLKDEELPEVAWIDPNFALAAMVPVVGGILDGVGSNDDHPPVGVIEAQRLVNKVYEALGRSANGKYWNDTLLVVYYDEHGGFYDHEAPPEGYGPRIPALLAGGPVKPGVCHTMLDHASLIKTVLLRFGWDNLEELAPDARERVMAATDLSVALRDDGGTTPFSPVVNPGDAAIRREDLEPKCLDQPASKLNRAINLLDRALTDLQEDIVKRHAIPLRTGRKAPARLPTKRLTKLAANRLPKRPERLPDRHP